jgi:hypothetical protein
MQSEAGNGHQEGNEKDNGCAKGKEVQDAEQSMEHYLLRMKQGNVTKEQGAKKHPWEDAVW